MVAWSVDAGRTTPYPSQLCQKIESQLLPIHIDFHDLFDAVVYGEIEIVFLGNGRRHESEVFSVNAGEREEWTGCVPSSHEMAALEKLDQGLGSSKADQCSRIKPAAQTRLWWPVFDVPRRRSIDRGYRNFGVLHGPDDGREWLADLTRETET